MINLVVQDCAQCIFRGHEKGLGHGGNTGYGCWAKAYVEPYTDQKTHFRLFTKDEIGAGWSMPKKHPEWCCLQEHILLTPKKYKWIPKSEYLKDLRQRVMEEFSERLDRVLALWNAEEVMSVEFKVDIKPSISIDIAEGRTTKSGKRTIEYSLVYQGIKGLWRLWQRL